MPDPIPRNPHYRGRLEPRRTPAATVPRTPRPPDRPGRPVPNPQSASRRRGFDLVVVILTVGACLTVLLPWLAGRYLLRDNFGRSNSDGVYDTTVRAPGAYFMTDWLSGTCAVLFVAAAIILISRHWGRRVPSIVVAFTMIGISLFWLGPSAIQRWHEAEANSLTNLQTTEYPFSDQYQTCGSSTVWFTPSGGTEYPISAFSAHIIGTPQNGCNRISIYKGWCLLKQLDLPAGEFIGTSMFTSTINSNLGTSSVSPNRTSASPNEIVFTADLTNDGTFQVALKDIDLNPLC